MENSQRQSASQLQELLNESRRRPIAENGTPPFFDRLLAYGGELLSAVAGVVWRRESDELSPLAKHRFQETEQFDSEDKRGRHRRFLSASLAAGQSCCVAPGETAAGVEFENPTDYTIAATPLVVSGKLLGILEFFLPETYGGGARKEILQLISQLRVPAEEFLLRSTLAELESEETESRAAETFALKIHESTEVAPVAYSASNEIRRIADCDRVTVTVLRRSTCRAAAVSGQDRFDSRSGVIRLLETLATLSARTGEVIACDESVGDVSPEIKRALYDYLEETHAKQLLVLPLRHREPPQDETEETPRYRVVGAVTVERLERSTDLGPLQARLEPYCRHTGAALGNAIEYEWPIFPAVGGTIRRSRLRRALQDTRLSVLIPAVIATIVAFFIFCPADFTLHAPGKLQPTTRRDVFAEVDGTVRTIYVKHGQDVVKGALLAELVNHELNVAEAELLKQIKETEQEVANTERELNDAQRAPAADRGKITARRATAVQRLQGFRAQAAVYADKRRRLRIESPIDGRVATWNVEELLILRPVKQGQKLFSIVDPRGDWELDVRLPEQRLGHLLEARQRMGASLPVSFVIAADPYHTRLAQVRDVHLAADVRDEEEGSTVLVKAALEEHDFPALNSGGEVRAKIHCGSRSLGYVWFHDVYEFIEMQILFRL